jgi:hypothetical protein
MTESAARFNPTDHRGSNSAFNYKPPPRERIPELRAAVVEGGLMCGSWHPTDPYKFCGRFRRHHAQGLLEHISGWSTWDGPFNPTRAPETTDQEGTPDAS